VRDLDEQLILEIGECMRMRQQERTAERGDQRKDKRRGAASQAASAHGPLEQSEGGDKRDEDAVLHHLRVAQAGEEADIA
jgi:hypothetical protein